MNTKFNDNFNFAPDEVGDASLKILFKTFLFEYFEDIEIVFQQADPKTKLNFYKSIIPYVLAKQSPNEHQGEWAPDQSMNTAWIKDYQYRKAAIRDKIQAKQEREQKTNELLKMQTVQTEYWRKEFYKAGAEAAALIKNDETFKIIKENIGKEQLGDEFGEALFKVIIAILRHRNLEPAMPVRIFDRTVYPSEYPISEAEAESQPPIEQDIAQSLPLSNDNNNGHQIPSTLDGPTTDSEDSDTHASILESDAETQTHQEISDSFRPKFPATTSSSEPSQKTSTLDPDSRPSTV